MGLLVAHALLAVNWIFALYSTWGLHLFNGGSDIVDAVLKAQPPLLPGTKYPVKTTYTGIKKVDEQFTLLTVMFWPILDGRMPHLSLFSFMFVGQALAEFVLLLLEASRHGNRGRLIA